MSPQHRDRSVHQIRTKQLHRFASERNVADVHTRRLGGYADTHRHTHTQVHCGRARGNQTKAVTWIYCIYNLQNRYYKLAHCVECVHAKWPHCSLVAAQTVALMLASRTAYVKAYLCVICQWAAAVAMGAFAFAPNIVTRLDWTAAAAAAAFRLD